MPQLKTSRLNLTPATADAVRADLESPQALASLLNVALPVDWPPELFDAAAMRWTLDALESGRFTPDWGLYYIVKRNESGARPGLIGVGGYKGGPAAGEVELGYGIVPEERRRGFALEAVEGWLRWAFEHDAVDRVIAHTLTHLAPSIGVLERAGFRLDGAGNDPDEPAAVRYVTSRADYLARTTARAS